MSGWRDANGRTAVDRQKQENVASRARFAERVRNRPLSLVKPVVSAVFVAILILALLLAFT